MNRVCLMSGSRTPFLRANTQFDEIKGYELLRHALLSTIKSLNISKDEINYVIAGITMQTDNSNIARDAVIAAGFDVYKTGAHSVTMACISANQAITSAANLIASHQIDCAIAGGVDSLSDPPIRVTRHLRKWLLKFNKTKTQSQKLGMFLKIRPSMIFGFESPAIGEFTTNETMGESCDRLTKAFNVSREEQDMFALRSHSLANKAQEEGLLTDVSPMFVPNVGLVDKDNGIRVSTIEFISKLKPAFTKSGSATAANASYLTDGASATLLISEMKAKQLGLKPKAIIKDYCYVAIDPKEHLLLGPTHATTQLLKKNNLSIDDIDVYEFHEAFSGQVLANLKAMDSNDYSNNKMGCDSIGLIPIEKLNTWGGSVSLGHPFGATGSRIVNMAINRLIKSDKRLALISACAGGGLGHAMIIQNYESL